MKLRRCISLSILPKKCQARGLNAIEIAIHDILGSRLLSYTPGLEAA